MAYDNEVNYVYKRRKIQKNCSSVLPLSQSSTPTFVYKRRKIHINPINEENPKSKMQKSLEFCAVSDNCSSSKSNVNLGSASMKLQVDKPYRSNVRIGKDFQAEVPDWSYSIITYVFVAVFNFIFYVSEQFMLTNDMIIGCSVVNDYGEPAEISHGECRPIILSTLGSIGNWLQCRQVIDSDGTICGKWRR